MKYAVQSAAMFESRFNSVERILAYAKLKPEAPHHIVGKQTAPSWPQAGVISFQNVVMKYRPELEPVLKVSPSHRLYTVAQCAGSGHLHSAGDCSGGLGIPGRCSH